MINRLPIEHLSPSQLQSLRCINNGTSVKIRSTSINGLIEIINQLDKAKEIVIGCSSHTIKHLQNYKDRHSHSEGEQKISRLSEVYNQTADRIEKQLC